MQDSRTLEEGKRWALFRCVCGEKFIGTFDFGGRCTHCSQTIFVGGHTVGMQYLRDLTALGGTGVIVIWDEVEE